MGLVGKSIKEKSIKMTEIEGLKGQSYHRLGQKAKRMCMLGGNRKKLIGVLNIEYLYMKVSGRMLETYVWAPGR